MMGTAVRRSAIVLIAVATACGYDSNAPDAHGTPPVPDANEGLWIASGSSPAILRLASSQLLSSGRQIPSATITTSSATLFTVIVRPRQINHDRLNAGPTVRPERRGEASERVGVAPPMHAHDTLGLDIHDEGAYRWPRSRSADSLEVEADSHEAAFVKLGKGTEVISREGFDSR